MLLARRRRCCSSPPSSRACSRCARATARATPPGPRTRSASAPRRLVDDRLERSLLLAQAGRELDDSVATRGYLLSALVRHPAAIGVMRGDGAGLLGAGAQPRRPGPRRRRAFDGTVLLFDTRTRERIGAPLQLDGDVGSLDFSPDGRLLAVSGRPARRRDASSVKLVDLATREAGRARSTSGRYPRDPELHTFVDARFADDGRAVLVSVQRERRRTAASRPYVRRYDARTGRPLGRAVASAGGPAIPAPVVPSRRDRLLFTPARTPPRRRRGDAARAAAIPAGGFSAGLSPDGRSAALGGEDGSVAILDLRTGERRTLAGRHEDRVHGLAFSPDGRTLVTTVRRRPGAGLGRALAARCARP